MLKFTTLLAFMIGACAVDSDNLDEITSASTTEECECKDDKCPPEPGPVCVDNGVEVDLDSAPANVDDFDGKVTFCHATSSATNPYNVITTSVNACPAAHEVHEHQEKGGHFDFFGTDGCED